jgi:cytosine permease
MSEYDRVPVAPESLKPARYFAASYAGEHVAGTEFVIGAMFVAWGVDALEVIQGLIIGNTLAVLSWVLICGPIATDTRLTVYTYLEKIAGPGFIKIYSVVNGVLMCILAGAMITVSASAVRILFDIPPQVNWYPSSPAFILVALGVGAFISYSAMRGFSFVARFAEVSAPWMISMFFIGALALMPTLIAGTPGVSTVRSINDFITLAETSIWRDLGTEMNIMHVIAIAWGANVAFHGALGDATILRFAKKTSYAWYSSLGMFIGHFAAWLAAGIMGAGAAMLLGDVLTNLDAGEVAFQALGAAGIIAVIIAGWTTSNPTIYRAGLAFQSLNPKWSREKVTLVVGVITAIIACFPFVFTRLLDYLGIMALVMAPPGGVIVAEHYILKKINLSRYWREITKKSVNVPAALTWVISVGVAALFSFVLEMHVLFLFVPAWITAVMLYPLLVQMMGVANVDQEAAKKLEAKEANRKSLENDYLSKESINDVSQKSGLSRILMIVSVIALMAGFWVAVEAIATGDLDSFKTNILITTVIYFSAAISLVFLMPKETDE